MAAGVKLLNKHDLAEMLSCTPGSVKHLMETWKIPAFYLGRGRGLGYRWREQDVLAAIEGREIGEERPKKKKKATFLTSHKEAMAYLNRKAA